jgi:hypothetical protein
MIELAALMFVVGVVLICANMLSDVSTLLIVGSLFVGAYGLVHNLHIAAIRHSLELQSRESSVAPANKQPKKKSKKQLEIEQATILEITDDFVDPATYSVYKER